MRRVLVSGGAGFIGSHVVDALLKRGDRVRVFDNLSTGRKQNLEGEEGAELMVGDLRDAAAVEKAVAGMTHVLHLAALPSVARSVLDPMTSHEVNSTGTLRLLEAARKAGIRRFVQASSSSVYGDQAGERKVESMTPRPLSPYAVTKLTAEHHARVYHGLFGMETVSMRYFNVFGPRQDPDSEYAAVIPRFIDRINRGLEPVVFGDGEQSRDFTFITNVVEANLLALERPDAGGLSLNCAAGRAFTLNRLIEEIGKLAGRKVVAEYQAARSGDIRHSLADIGLAGRVLGYQPKVSFEEGLAITFASFAGQ